MSNTLPPHAVLSKLEENKCNRLQADLAILTAKRELLELELKAAEERLIDIENRRHYQPNNSVMASEIAALETARHEEIVRKEGVSKQLRDLSGEEKQFKAEVFASIIKSNAYESLRDKEKKQQERLSSRSEQQAVDDLMANRRMKGYGK